MNKLRIYRLLLDVCIIFIVALPVAARGSVSSLTSATTARVDNELSFSFYGQLLHADKVPTVKVKSVREYDVFKAWHDYQKRDLSPALSSLRSLSDEMGLNDWFVFELIRNYADGLLSEGTPMDRVVLEHYLLNSMGFDVRLARTERQLLLLVPLEQEVYEHYFIKIGDKDYYLFYDNLDFNPNEKSVICPCDPSTNNFNKGQSFSLLFKDKALKVSSDEDKLCTFDDGLIHVDCMVNPYVMRMLHDYPLMDLQCYAASVVLPQFHAAIQEQLMPQLEGMSQCDAAEALLHFVQYVFGYEDDYEQYGKEKVNFIEENFYYDNNDCEDRSILYAFLVNSLLGLDVQFIHYPGHDCTAVHFTDCSTRGNGYYYGDDYYLICDPSYIGASIGRCMPEYRSVQPAVKFNVPVLATSAKQSPLEPRLDTRLVLTDLLTDSIAL